MCNVFKYQYGNLDFLEHLGGIAWFSEQITTVINKTNHMRINFKKHSLISTGIGKTCFSSTIMKMTLFIILNVSCQMTTWKCIIILIMLMTVNFYSLIVMLCKIDVPKLVWFIMLVKLQFYPFIVKLSVLTLITNHIIIIFYVPGVLKILEFYWIVSFSCTILYVLCII